MMTCTRCGENDKFKTTVTHTCLCCGETDSRKERLLSAGDTCPMISCLGTLHEKELVATEKKLENPFYYRMCLVCDICRKYQYRPEWKVFKQ